VPPPVAGAPAGALVVAPGAGEVDVLALVAVGNGARVVEDDGADVGEDDGAGVGEDDGAAEPPACKVNL